MILFGLRKQASLSSEKIKTGKKKIMLWSTDRDRTRTCNPQIRSLMPYPLGHAAQEHDCETWPERWSTRGALIKCMQAGCDWKKGGHGLGALWGPGANGAGAVSTGLCFASWLAQSQGSVGGIMVSIAAFQAVDPGSIPGRRRSFVEEELVG